MEPLVVAWLKQMDKLVGDNHVETLDGIGGKFACDANGAGQMIKGFDAAVVDMQVGEKKTVHIPAADAYGEHNPEMVITFPAEQVPNIEQIEKGMKLFLSTPSGMPVPAVVIDVTPDAVTLDANHELAGKDLNFDIELVEVEG